MGEGVLYESLNLAATLGAPVLFVVEDNEIAQTTPKELAVAGSILDRARPFGIRTYNYDGADVFDLHTIALDAVEYVREAGRPAWLYIRTERMGPHSKGDDTRPAERVETARSKDPVALVRARVQGADKIDAFCYDAVEQAIASAFASLPARG